MSYIIDYNSLMLHH